MFLLRRGKIGQFSGLVKEEEEWLEVRIDEEEAGNKVWEQESTTTGPQHGGSMIEVSGKKGEYWSVIWFLLAEGEDR